MDEVPIIVGQGDMTATAPVTSEQNLAGRARCPRCGYDLRGAIGTWTDQCPLHGTCTECGLQFAWAEVLHPEKFEPRWCIEFAPGMRRGVLLRASLATFIRSFWPFGFWRALKMSMPIRWRRLVMYIAILCLPLLASYVTIQSAAALRVRSNIAQILTTTRQEIAQSIIRLQQSYVPPDAPWQRQSVLAEIQRLQAIMAAGDSINHSPLDAVIEAVLTPFSKRSRGIITLQGAVIPYPGPRRLHSRALQEDVFSVNPLTGRPRIDLTIAWFGLGVWMWLLLPLSFVLLPVSRRRAKVRWGHIARVSAYGFFIPVTAIVGSMLCISIGYALDPLIYLMLRCAHVLSRYFMPALIIIWWATSIRHYLRMPHSWFVAVLLSGMLFLLYLAALWFIYPDFLLALW
ncbi:MAG: hypothetical protein IIB53_15515 [Planctomycetes bacterium]|nr:hypothetical protein [Planctomycetota bacterium]